MIAFILMLTLVLHISDTNAEDNYPVETIHSGNIVVPIDELNLKDHLRLDEYSDRMPDTLIAHLECYSDGSGGMALLADHREVWALFTARGKLIINDHMVDIGSAVCQLAEEAYNESQYRESTPTWYL